MLNLFNNSICKAFVLIFFMHCNNVLAEQKIDFLETTGRAVITDEESLNDARRNSLEDAIFLAAMQGGAQIDGFSSVDRETNISDHFTVRPTSKLLDFDIISESIDGNHYKTVIRAAVGQLNSTK